MCLKYYLNTKTEIIKLFTKKCFFVNKQKLFIANILKEILKSLDVFFCKHYKKKFCSLYLYQNDELCETFIN